MSKRRGNRTREQTDDARVIDQGKVWFVAKCLPTQDTKAVEKLTEVGVDVWMPVYRAKIVRRAKKVEIERRFFASYLFVGLEPNARGELNYRDVLDCRFVYQLLGNDSPASFPADLLQLLANRLAGQDRDETERGKRKESAARFGLGSFHKIIGGPFSSFMAEITAVLSTGRIVADVDIFGRRTPMELEPEDLAAA